MTQEAGPAPSKGWPARAQDALARLGLARAPVRPVVYGGNRIALLVNGDAYFPELLAAIEGARRSVHLETYIFADDKIGERVVAALAAAASRGVEVRVLIDGYGGGEHARRLQRELPVHGVAVRIFRPERWWRLERKLLRRLHRKLAVVDDRIAFVGGINIVDDFKDVPPHATGRVNPRFDFAVRLEGPIVGAVALAARRLWWTVTLMQSGEGALTPPRLSTVPQPRFADGVPASLLLRDNLRNRRTIERAYLAAIASARQEVLIANAYFLPGRRFRAALREAVARGVRVRLLLQGRVEYPIQHYAQRAMYGDLLGAGIEIHEYQASYLHAKVAAVDDSWATVGSSNIEPVSLLLAREANVTVYDARFVGALRAELERAIAQDSAALHAQDYARRGLLARLADWGAYAIVRLATVVLARAPGY
jgi:cardiolipin synthase